RSSHGVHLEHRSHAEAQARFGNRFASVADATCTDSATDEEAGHDARSPIPIADCAIEHGKAVGHGDADRVWVVAHVTETLRVEFPARAQGTGLEQDARAQVSSRAEVVPAGA